MTGAGFDFLHASFEGISESADQILPIESKHSETFLTQAPAPPQNAETKHETGFISDLALILVVAAITAVLFKRMKQPVVLGYIVAGFLVGPHFSYLPTVVNEASIDLWAELGIIFLMFSIGLEFSFKKLLNVGGSAAATALIIIICMMSTGYFAGKIMGFTFISSLFLGGMLSMSSTTIIYKALGDLNLMHRRFTPQVLAVLVVEDLFAVVLMVLLSSVAINNSVEGGELFASIAKLAFFLILWFLVGVYLIPTFLEKQRRFLTDELLLVFSIGLCFLMVIFATYSGFSTALGAFVMGSILAGTSAAERIDKLISPVKNLFGAIFFISVGMMVNPEVISQYAIPILVLSAIVIVGMIVFGTFGMLVTGQSLRISIESGFCLTQIGEFSFILASLGMSLGVINKNLYPIVVSVSVITTFFTPYFIRMSDPFSRWVENKMPQRLMSLINRYSTSTTHNESEIRKLWKEVILRSLWSVLLYSVILLSITFLAQQLLFPIMIDAIDYKWGRLAATVITVLAMAPFLLALSYPSSKAWKRERLQNSIRTNMPFFVVKLFRILVAFTFIIGFLTNVYSHVIGVTMACSLIILVLILLSKSVRRHMNHIESTFINNLNERELRRSGKNNNLVSDMHLAFIDIGYKCPFVGERLCDSNIGKNFGINVVSIQRGDTLIQLPTGDSRIFPGDTLGIIGTDDQIQSLLAIIEKDDKPSTTSDDIRIDDMEFTSIVLSDKSPIAGQTVAHADIRRNYSALLVSVEHPDGSYETPTADTVLHAGENLWIFGDKRKLKNMI